MRLNTIKPADGAKKQATRVGRGIGSGKGKTSGRGHKGALARSGSSRRLGFEGGQMPLHRRLPKSGFSSRLATVTDEIRLDEIAKIADEHLDNGTITLAVLRKAGLINKRIKKAKIFMSGEINKAVTIVGLGVTRGAREAIEAAGGKVSADVEE